MQNSAINSLPIYQNSDPLDYGAQMSALVKAIDARAPGRFATKAAADSAYGAHTAQGGVLADGMIRSIAGGVQVYRGGSWRGIQPVVTQQNTFFATTYGQPDEAGVATLAIPDLGYPVTLDVSGAVTVYANAGVLVNVQIRLDSVTGSIISPSLPRDGAMPNGAGVAISFPPFRTFTITGAHQVLLTVKRTGGSGNWAVTADGNFLRADLVPA